MQNERPSPLLAADFKVCFFRCTIGCSGSHQTSYWSGQLVNEPQMSTSLSGIIVVFNIDISRTN